MLTVPSPLSTANDSPVAVADSPAATDASVGPETDSAVDADNIYRMDVSAMLESHIESGLECTVAGIRVPRSEASAFGKEYRTA